MPSATLQRLLFADKGRLVPTTLSAAGTLITPAVRSQGLQGDGLAPMSGTGIWPAATNLLTAPTDFSNAAWTAGGDVSKTSTTELDPGGGNTGGLFTATSASNDLFQPVTVLASTTYTVSWWAKRGSATDLFYFVFDTSHSSQLVAKTSYYASTNASTATRISHTFTTPAGCTGLNISLAFQTPTGTFSCAWPQLETGAVATPFTPTSRAAGRIRVPASLINATQGWVAIRMRASFVSALVGHQILAWFAGSYIPDNQLGLSEYCGYWGTTREGGGIGAGSASAVLDVAVGDYITVVGTWTATGVGLSLNGAVFTIAAQTTIPTGLPETIDFGSLPSFGNIYQLDANILWFACGTGTLSDGDAAMIHAFGNSDVGLNAYPGNASGLWDGNTPEFVYVRTA